VVSARPLEDTPAQHQRQDRRCPAGRYGGDMTAQPAAHPDPGEQYEVIRLGGETAAIVPLTELLRLQAVARRAPAELLEEAEIEATLTAHRQWAAAGRPDAVSHQEAMTELLTSQ
jgi:hypothetical protein